jgi:hypothetical protein
MAISQMKTLLCRLQQHATFSTRFTCCAPIRSISLLMIMQLITENVVQMLFQLGTCTSICQIQEKLISCVLSRSLVEMQSAFVWRMPDLRMRQYRSYTIPLTTSLLAALRECANWCGSNMNAEHLGFQTQWIRNQQHQRCSKSTASAKVSSARKAARPAVYVEFSLPSLISSQSSQYWKKSVKPEDMK